MQEVYDNSEVFYLQYDTMTKTPIKNISGTVQQMICLKNLHYIETGFSLSNEERNLAIVKVTLDFLSNNIPSN